VPRRQIYRLDVAAVEKAVAGDEQRIGPLARKICEASIDLAAGAYVPAEDMPPVAAIADTWRRTSSAANTGKFFIKARRRLGDESTRASADRAGGLR